MKHNRYLSTILLWSGVLLTLGFMTLAKKSQANNFDLVLSIGSFLTMSSFVFHQGEMRGRGITLRGKPAEYTPTAMIAVLGLSSIYFLLHHLGII